MKTPFRFFAILAVAFCLFGDLASAQEPLNKANFDPSVRIQDDLFEHVNGTWLKTTEIPSDKSNYGSFIKLADLSQLRIKEIVESVSTQQHPKGTDAQKVADFYRSFMDVEKINALGAGPIREELAKIASISNKADLVQHFGRLSQYGIGSPIGMYVGQDQGEPTQYIVQIAQSGTSLPDRDYYLKDDEGSTKAREKLTQYIAKLFELSSSDDYQSLAGDIVAFETSLAKAQWSKVMLRDAKKRYNKMSFAELGELTDGQIDWAAYLAAAGVAQTPEQVIVLTPSFFEALAGLMEETDLKILKAYLAFNLIDRSASMLSQDFVDASFELYQKQLSGIEEQKPRWKRGVNLVAGAGAGDFGALGEVVGKLYVEKHFKPAAKAEMEKLVSNLLAAFDNSIDNLTWMTDETKGKAKEKLAKITTKIGYPNKWRDYSKLDVEPNDLFGNVMRSSVVEHNRNISKLGQPIDREEWGMTPQTVNAYYSPTKNEIVFPAAILQTPFFDLNAPKALNYGGIGAVIGHEISHAFDDQGSKYDGDGALKNWWTDADREAFAGLTSRLVAQYSDYEPLEGKTVNGQLTLGENIADLSGLEVSHRALTLALQGEQPEKVAGWNADQLFFVGWSRVWQRKYKDKEMVKRLLTDPHSPSKYRANGPVTNIEAFYKAFDVKPGDKLYKPESQRIKIW
jgi:predicted metalloendopeptidase